MMSRREIFDLDSIKIKNFSTANCVRWIERDIIHNDVYGINNINFVDNDIIIDIGANVGIFSCYLAKLYPNIIIHSFEPLSINYEHLLENIKINDISNVISYNLAITKDERSVTLSIDEYNTGGASVYGIYKYATHINECKSINLNNFISKNNIKNIKLLKIDCEGAEYEILNSFKYWHIVEHLSIEIHNVSDNNTNHSIDELTKTLNMYINNQKLSITYA